MCAKQVSAMDEFLAKRDVVEACQMLQFEKIFNTGYVHCTKSVSLSSFLRHKKNVACARQVSAVNVRFEQPVHERRRRRNSSAA